MRWSARSPTCQSPVPALVEATRSPRPAASANHRNTTSAIGDRQMLPVHTNTTWKGSTAVAVMGTFCDGRRGSCTTLLDFDVPPQSRSARHPSRRLASDAGWYPCRCRSIPTPRATIEVLSRRSSAQLTERRSSGSTTCRHGLRVSPIRRTGRTDAATQFHASADAWRTRSPGSPRYVEGATEDVARERARIEALAWRYGTMSDELDIRGGGASRSTPRLCAPWRGGFDGLAGELGDIAAPGRIGRVAAVRALARGVGRVGHDRGRAPTDPDGDRRGRRHRRRRCARRPCLRDRGAEVRTRGGATRPATRRRSRDIDARIAAAVACPPRRGRQAGLGALAHWLAWPAELARQATGDAVVARTRLPRRSRSRSRWSRAAARSARAEQVPSRRQPSCAVRRRA